MSAIDKREQTRAAQVKAMPVTELSMFHTENCKVLPNRMELLERLPKNGVCAEIGAAFGDYTSEIIARNSPSQLHLIDAWDTERYKVGMDEIKKKFSSKVSDGSLKLHQGYSTEKLKTFSDGFFDWVYIDTNHMYETTWDELVLSNAKVKRNGHIAGHDFCTGNVVRPMVYGVVQAVSRFCKEFGWQYEYITLESYGHFSFCLKRIGE